MSSITKEKNGTYTVHYDIYDVIKNKKKRTKSRGYATLKEAKEFEHSVSREGTKVTFYTLFTELQSTIQQEPDTLKTKIGRVNRYLSSIKDLPYDSITKPILNQVRSSIAKQELSAKTKNSILELITATCEFANTIYDLPNYSKVLKRFKQEKTEFEVWSMEEYQQFEQALVGSRYEDMIPVFHSYYMTGMRKGELRALNVNDLDVDNKCLIITKSMRKYKNSLKAPKTPSGFRKILLDDNTFNMLLPFKNHEKWLFGDYRAISRDRIDRAFAFGIKKSGVKKIRLHDLRHSHASYLLSKNVNIVALSKRLGHKSITVTLNTYGHLMKDAENQLVETLNVANLLPANSKKPIK